MSKKVFVMSLSLLQNATEVKEAFRELVQATATRHPMPSPVMPALQQQYAARQASNKDVRSLTTYRGA